MAEALQANGDWMLWFLQGVGLLHRKFHVEGDTPPTICARLDRQVNVLEHCR